MKKVLLLFTLVLMGTATLQAQTIALPTKRTTEKTVKKEGKKTAKTPKKNVEQKSVPQKVQNGTIALPTVKKEANEAQKQVKDSTVTAPPQIVNGVPQLPVIVRRQEAPRAKPIVSKPKKEDNTIYESAEHMPTYPGGAGELMKFISENMHYPEEAINDNAQGIVQVSFIVEKDGKPTEFEVLDEHHPALESEAVRILQQMPKWNPAMQNGIKVRVEYVVPVKFTLPNQ